jgi:hypothetical protein
MIRLVVLPIEGMLPPEGCAALPDAPVRHVATAMYFRLYWQAAGIPPRHPQLLPPPVAPARLCSRAAARHISGMPSATPDMAAKLQKEHPAFYRASHIWRALFLRSDRAAVRGSARRVLPQACDWLP